jgi:hypothetical protein
MWEDDMRSRALFLSATATLSFACATAFLPLLPPGQALAQGNPTVANVIPEGRHYSAQGKVHSLDPGALRLVLVTAKAGPVPMTIAPEADLSNISVGDVAESPLIATSIAKCGAFGMGLLGC